MASQPLRFILAFFGTLAVGVLTIGAFNHFVDPYDMRITFADGGQDVHRPAVGEFAKISKPFAVAALKPDGAILGTSRSHHALDPNHPAWPAEARRAFNFAQAGTTITELRRSFEHLLSVDKPRIVVLELDFYAFNIHRQHSPDFDDALLQRSARDWLRPTLRRAELLVSIDTLQASLAAIGASPNAESDYEPNGRINDRLYERKVLAYKGHRAVFLKSERSQYIEPFYAMAPTQRPSYRGRGGAPGLDEFARILALTRENNVDLRCFIAPLHARQWEVFRALGLEPEILAWKHDLVRMLDAEASAHHGATAFPLWDFSGYNSITIEALPPAGDQSSRMSWYWESSHFKREAGDLVLNRLFDPQAKAYKAPADFGVRLTPSTIDAALEEQQLAGRRYRATHAADLDEIAAAVASARARAQH